MRQHRATRIDGSWVAAGGARMLLPRLLARPARAAFFARRAGRYTPFVMTRSATLVSCACTRG